MIDLRRVPRRVMFDTSALSVAVLNAPATESIHIRKLYDVVTTGDRVLLVAAPSLAELLRAHGADLPRGKNIEVVAFDSRAARILVDRVPKALITAAVSSTGDPIAYFKYDAMIIACALRHKADCIVSLDGQQNRMAEAAGMECRQVRSFLKAQMEIEGVLGAEEEEPASS